jgi:hypothetical protein
VSKSLFELVKRDLDDRNELGKLQYGKELVSDDKRDFLIEAYQEALDMVIYLKGALLQRGPR